MPQTFVSTTERRLLVLLMALITCTYFLDLENKAVENYNQSVKYEQEKKENSANNPTQKNKVSFGFSNCHYGTSFWYLLYGLQFFTNPLGCFLLRKGTFKRFTLALFFNFLTFLCFIVWSYEAFTAYKAAERLPDRIESLNQFVLYDSTKTEFTLFVFVSFCFAVQTFILLRFVLEKFQAKISFK